MEFGAGPHEPTHQEPPFCQIRVVFPPLYGDLLMKRPLWNRTVGAVRGGNPTLYSIFKFLYKLTFPQDPWFHTLLANSKNFSWRQVLIILPGETALNLYSKDLSPK